MKNVAKMLQNVQNSSKILKVECTCLGENFLSLVPLLFSYTYLFKQNFNGSDTRQFIRI